MKTILATAAMTLMFLSAGALAAIGHNQPASGPLANVTIVYKS
jgi:hypothetical protein